MRSDKFLVECKATQSDYYSLTSTTWNKIADEALRDGIRLPLMCIEIKGKKWAVLDLNDFNAIDTKDDGEELVPVVVKSKSFRLHFDSDDKVVYQCQWGRFTLFLLVIEWDEFLTRIKE